MDPQQMRNVLLCCTVALRWSSGKGKFWPIVADQEPRIAGFSVTGERQLMAESARLVVAYISHH